MSKSSIEWTDETWNPLAGCTRVSPGCDHCYAAKMALRIEAMALADIAAGKDPGGKRKYIGTATKNGKGIPVFNGTVNLDYDALEQPYSWKKPRRVFVNSMSDLFHGGVRDNFILGAFAVMKDTPMHTYQVLTKRPERAAGFLEKYGLGWPSNIWIGTSVENQQTADERIPELLKIPARVRFLSCEPLLGPVVLSKAHQEVIPAYLNREIDNLPVVDWVIVGGESGPHARPMHPQWARDIRDQCQAAGVPFFFKQWGKFAPSGDCTPLPGYVTDWVYLNEETTLLAFPDQNSLTSASAFSLSLK